MLLGNGDGEPSRAPLGDAISDAGRRDATPVQPLDCLNALVFFSMI
jgi:hypothetical protein